MSIWSRRLATLDIRFAREDGWLHWLKGWMYGLFVRPRLPTRMQAPIALGCVALWLLLGSANDWRDLALGVMTCIWCLELALLLGIDSGHRSEAMLQWLWWLSVAGFFVPLQRSGEPILLLVIALLPVMLLTRVVVYGTADLLTAYRHSRTY